MVEEHEDRRRARTSPGPDDPGSWYTDPFARHESRWWDGRRWTEKVRNHRDGGIDPPGIDPAPHAAASETPEPAAPIADARIPLRPPPVSTQLARLLGLVTIVGLVVLTVIVAVVTL